MERSFWGQMGLFCRPTAFIFALRATISGWANHTTLREKRAALWVPRFVHGDNSILNLLSKSKAVLSRILSVNAFEGSPKHQNRKGWFFPPLWIIMLSVRTGG